MKIFIAGGTSGMGAALAAAYQKQGHEVAVCGRSLDIYNKEALRIAVSNFAGDELDMMIIAAGSYADDSRHEIAYEESVDMLKVNIAGVVNALEVAREAMYKQQKGHIVVFASVSGLLHHKKATVYSKTKRALIQISEAYRRALANFGICVTIIAPGYVDTPRLRELNGGDLSRKLFVVSCEEAVERIMQGIADRRELVVFPSRMKYLIRFLSGLPSWLLNIIMYRKAKWMNRK